MAIVATVPSIVKETKDSVNASSTCSNKRNECSYRVFVTAGRVCIEV